MSHTVNGRSAASVVRSLYAPIADELAAVEQILDEQLRSRHAFVDELVQYGRLLGGKRLRPALLLLAGKASGKIRREHLLLAAVVEMIHTATLVHDDVLDEAQMRRRHPTVNARWDDETSVLLGDFLFTHAFYLASTVSSTLACQTIGRATNIVCEGEIRQKGVRGDFGLSERGYLQIVSAKTAELCACSCRLGAHYAGGEKAAVERLTRYGRDLGVAFQITDDLLDVLGDEQTAGKTLGSDLDQLRPTLPLICALDRADGRQRRLMLDILHAPGAERRRELTPHLQQLGALDYTRQRAHWFARRAARRVESLPASDARRVLLELSEFVVHRSH